MAQTERIEHTTSIAVWDVPSPLTIHGRSNVKVGVKCTDGCCLAGATIAILDDKGAQVATATLQSVPWAGTTALYWADVDLPEVAGEGPHNWSAVFLTPRPDGSQRAVLHRNSSFPFSFQAVRLPEHRVTVRIVEEQTANPVDGVEMRLGVYRARSENGIATFEVAAGTYELSLWKPGHNIASISVEVNGNLTVDVGLSKAAAVEEPYWM